MSLLQTVYNSTQTVAQNAAVNLGSVVKRSCDTQAKLDGNSIIIRGGAYHTIIVSMTVSAPAAGNVTLAITKDGTAINGSTATETITTADTELHSMTLTAVVKNMCCVPISSIAVLNQGIAATITNVNVIVKGDN